MLSQHSSAHGSLTRYPPGSFRESWHLIFPMILTTASISLMMFADRVILAQYSTKAMTAAASAGIIVVTFEIALLGIAGIAEVFVGQHNGAQDYKRTAEPVWQMIWLSLLSMILFVPIALFGAEFFVADPFDNLGVPYFRGLMLFGFLTPLNGALSSFFVGLGKPRIVTWIVGLGNAINIILDIILILGIQGWIEPMGTLGAAIATNIALGLQSLILFCLFLRKKYGTTYGSYDFRFKLKPFWDCVKIGAPTSISHFVELSAWSFQLNVIAMVSEIHVTVVAVGQSIFLLFMFIADGLSRGLSSIASNYMGAQNYDIIPQCFFSAFKILLIFALSVLLIFIFYSHEMIHLLVQGDYPPEILKKINIFSHQSLKWVWLFIFVDGIVWICVGILTAAGDTKFIMIANGFNAWFFGILPLYICVIYFKMPPSVAWLVISFYGVINMSTFYWRYRAGSWRVNRVRLNMKR